MGAWGAGKREPWDSHNAKAAGKAARTGLRGRHRNLPHSGRWYSARHSRRKPLCLSRLLALEGAKTRTVGLLIEKLLHALRAAVFLVDETQGIALGVEVVGGLR